MGRKVRTSPWRIRSILCPVLITPQFIPALRVSSASFQLSYWQTPGYSLLFRLLRYSRSYTLAIFQRYVKGVISIKAVDRMLLNSDGRHIEPAEDPKMTRGYKEHKINLFYYRSMYFEWVKVKEISLICTWAHLHAWKMHRVESDNISTKRCFLYVYTAK